MNRLLILTVLFVLLNNLNFAQTGTLRGKVIDISTGEELIGTTIMLVGTLQGAATDLDGNYTVSNIEAGIYDVKISFISYETQIVTGVEIVADDIFVLNVNLEPVSVGLSEVIVEAKAIKNTETAIIAMQRKSATLIDGISSQQISRTDDSDAASALQRVTGISVEGGKYVYVRGLGDRYSKASLNGAELPGLDPNRNTVQMDLFPSNIIENMVVYKTFSPDLPGSFTGGYVNIITKDFPDRYTFQFSTSAGYNTNSSFNNDFLTYDGGKIDWLGIDDGGRKIPGEATGGIPALYQDNDRLDNVTRSFNKTWENKRQISFMDHSHSLSWGNQVKLGGKSLGYVAGLSYSRKYSSYDNGVVGRYRLVGSTSENLTKDALYDDSKGVMEVLWGALLNLTYKINNKNKISLNTMYNSNGEKLSRYMLGEVPSDGSGRYRETRTLSFVERSLASFQLRGEHFLENVSALKIDWLSSFSLSSQIEPDLRFFTNSFYPEASGEAAYSINTSEYADPARYYRDMHESTFDNKLNFILPFNIMGGASKLKFGGALVYKVREFVEKRYNFATQQPEKFNGIIEDYFRDSNIGQAGIDPITGNYGIYVQTSKDEDDKNSYDADQMTYAGYAMVDIPLFQKLRVILGARLEATDINAESRNPAKPKGQLSNVDLLPALNLTYSITEAVNLRAAYTRTIARPSFRELAPYASFDFQGDYVIVGNANLKRTLVDNIDLRWEWFQRPGEILSVSGFYKRFTNPIERTFNPEAGNDELTWRNVDQALVYGVEAEIRKQLDFISGLRFFRLGLNVTYVYSQVRVDERELENIHATEPEYPDTKVMFGQSPYIVNALLSYDNSDKGWHSNLSFNITGKRMVTVILGGTPNIYEQPAGLLNFNISKHFGKNIILKFSGENLLNPYYRETYTRWDEKNSWRSEEYIYQQYRLGRKFVLSFSYVIK